MVDAELLLQLERLEASIGLPAATPDSWGAEIGDPVVLHPGEEGGVLLLQVMMVVVVGDWVGMGVRVLVLVRDRV